MDAIPQNLVEKYNALKMFFFPICFGSTWHSAGHLGRHLLRLNSFVIE
jgi:hypothetical protein